MDNENNTIADLRATWESKATALDNRINEALQPTFAKLNITELEERKTLIRLIQRTRDYCIGAGFVPGTLQYGLVVGGLFETAVSMNPSDGLPVPDAGKNNQTGFEVGREVITALLPFNAESTALIKEMNDMDLREEAEADAAFERAETVIDAGTIAEAVAEALGEGDEVQTG